VRVFAAAQTQWQVSMSGVVGLRYEALPVLLECQGVPRDQWPEVMDCLQVMEREAIELWRSKR
jgi:hypothetical protein